MNIKVIIAVNSCDFLNNIGFHCNEDILVKRFSMHELHSYVWAYYDEMKALGIEIEDNIKLVNSTNPNSRNGHFRVKAFFITH